MADKEKELDLDGTDKKAGKGKLILIIVMVTLLISGGTVAGLYFSGMLGGGPDAASGEQNDDAAVTTGPAIYFELKPEFVVNFDGQQGANYLQVDIQLMTRDAAVLKTLQDHAPLIRNNILLLLSGQQYAELRTLAGKEKMRAEVLATVQAVVEAEYGKPAIESVFFTSFIMQ
ncbi:MAG: flagellar basal body-associated FliL family protein [Gammaproteobacteria bacterium]